jgi:hypothetical protein
MKGIRNDPVSHMPRHTRTELVRGDAENLFLKNAVNVDFGQISMFVRIRR